MEDVARRFGHRWALRGASLRVECGQVIALVGRNGSGKSTLLRIAATLLRPTRGGGAVFGHDLRRSAAQARAHVGMLGHRPGLYDDLTAVENLRFAAAMLAVPVGAGRLADLLEAVGLGHDADERVRTFSAGMQRRLALARLLLRPPALLLLDEPYASFDDEGITLVNSLLRETRDRGGAAVVATHELDRARGVVDGVVRLERGHAQPDESLDRVRDGAAAPGPRAMRPAERVAGGGL